MTPHVLRCKAITSDGRCKNHKNGSNATCRECAVRIANSMHRTMALYGRPVSDLVIHWERYHLQGATCPTCFAAAWERHREKATLGKVANQKSLDGPYPHATV
jgi:hypothetical protein